MEEPHSVSSPRRILSLSRKKRPGVCFVDSVDKASGCGVSGEHGPKTLDVHGFVGSINNIAATGAGHWLFQYRLWWQHCWLCDFILNFMPTPLRTSLNTIFVSELAVGTLSKAHSNSVSPFLNVTFLSSYSTVDLLFKIIQQVVLIEIV